MKTHLVLHHSLTKDGQTVSWNAIRRYHMLELGWLDNGYNFGVEDIGGSYEILAGRPLLARAAAAYQNGMNRKGVHVCFVGNYDLAPPPVAMLDVAARFLADICEALSIPLTTEFVTGHRDVAPYKSCPGKHFDVADFVRRLRGA